MKRIVKKMQDSQQALSDTVSQLELEGRRVRTVESASVDKAHRAQI